MIDSSTFDARLNTCRACEFWRGVCVKGHALRGDLGCPDKKFEGINGAGYVVSLPFAERQLPAVSASGCCGSVAEQEIKPMSWRQVWDHFTASMKTWSASGFELADNSLYLHRLSVCHNCPKSQYQWYQCRQCKCLVYTKTKLSTESCPLGFW